MFLTNSSKSYNFIYNSDKNSRGVGILIDSSLTYTITDSYKDSNQNILGLNITLDGISFFLVSIYGPNDNDKSFFNNLYNVLISNLDRPIIVGGDWNTTYSTSDSSSNIDILHMQKPSSQIRSGWLNEICLGADLIDPYRAFYPSRRDYTFIPHGTKKNRSRLDFFLISSDKLHFAKRCIIANSLSTSLFDHKLVSLSFLHEKMSSKLSINRTILSNPRTDDVVLAAFADTYLAHAGPLDAEGAAAAPQLVFRHNNRDPLEAQRILVGTFIRQIRDLNDLTERSRNETQNNLLKLLIAEKETEIELSRVQIWSADRFSNLALNCDADYFLEALASNIKGAVVSFQTWVKKTDNLEKANLISELNNLKKDYTAISSTIVSLESRLNKIMDAEILLKVKSMKLFSCLNSEKPTPMFLRLARTSNSCNNLSSIRNSDGSPYKSDKDRIEGIVSYYENIYRIPTSDCVNYSECIEQFLGPDILSHPLVINSKLAQEEKERLDLPLSIDELDSSVDNCNMRSAPGIDGLSNLFIKKYWHYFRIPLFNYATTCLQKKTLTTNFRSACIKLIPKKGNLSDLKNWRPISLLSNMYKIISRAINARLNSVVNRICSRAQKGFNNQRYTQECLINVIETIAHCNANNIDGALVAVDMAKAFDTLSHGFLREVFRFFNIGKGMIDWLTLLGENRAACILLDDGSYSRNFKLDRGRAQGDNISPNTFNFADQILILKIELDPGINGI
jgi:exonuclease III